MIVVAGAGSIGCFVGGLLSVGGKQVALLGRAKLVAQIAQNGLLLTDFAGLERRVDPADIAKGKMTLGDDPAILARATMVLVAVKSADTAEMAQLIKTHAAPDVPIVSLQNGVRNAAILREVLGAARVHAAMVPFNVVAREDGHFHRASSGDILLDENGVARFAAQMSTPDLQVQNCKDIEAVQWGKLLINLNNAPNALAGLPIKQQLMRAAWRDVMADQMTEALAVLRAARIKVKATTPVPAWLIPHILRLPTWLFAKVAAQMLTIDPMARASMQIDLQLRRHTEIDQLQGEIIALGASHGVETPLCRHIAGLLKKAETAGQGSPILQPEALRPG